jgi:hypothetical protein
MNIYCIRRLAVILVIVNKFMSRIFLYYDGKYIFVPYFLYSSMISICPVFIYASTINVCPAFFFYINQITDICLVIYFKYQ